MSKNDYIIARYENLFVDEYMVQKVDDYFLCFDSLQSDNIEQLEKFVKFMQNNNFSLISGKRNMIQLDEDKFYDVKMYKIM